MSSIPKKTLVLGASPNPSRYSFLAVQRLRKAGHPVLGIGKRLARVADVDITAAVENWKDIDTVTIYLNKNHQKEYYDYLVSLHPRRVIFNPGAENEELADLLASHGIPTEESCTLVLLSTGQY